MVVGYGNVDIRRTIYLDSGMYSFHVIHPSAYFVTLVCDIIVQVVTGCVCS
jgi:hypothetical protein